MKFGLKNNTLYTENILLDFTSPNHLSSKPSCTIFEMCATAVGRSKIFEKQIFLLHIITTEFILLSFSCTDDILFYHILSDFYKAGSMERWSLKYAELSPMLSQSLQMVISIACCILLVSLSSTRTSINYCHEKLYYLVYENTFLTFVMSSFSPLSFLYEVDLKFVPIVSLKSVDSILEL